jgi:hypothetical protein
MGTDGEVAEDGLDDTALLEGQFEFVRERCSFAKEGESFTA